MDSSRRPQARSELQRAGIHKLTAPGRTLACAVKLVLLTAPASLCHAQADTLEEVVVTSQRRSENVQDVPISVSVYSADEIARKGVTELAPLTQLAPNVTIDSGTPFSGSSFALAAYIRGIGQNDFAFNLDPGVGVYLDGVYL